LHLVADWPGYFPNGPQIAKLLIDTGADPDARTNSQDAQWKSGGLGTRQENVVSWLRGLGASGASSD
jgi:hypothetical protein